MPKLVIDNIEVEVPPGTNVLEAARKVGIVIPHFCYHPALGSVGACRLCAMKFLDGPVKGIQMSCMIPAQDGMVISTTDGEAARMRAMVIEWLMENHPHDCPVCDEGGECLLQDYTIAGGHALRRFTGKKRTFVSQYLGPYIHHEMNRCIECYRCVRFYQEYAGGTDFGVMGSAGRVYFGRFQEGDLESPFSGNLVDLCPTGVFTDRTSRYRARYWDYEMAPSVCPHCSVGCNVIPVGRYRELLKTVARVNNEVNGWFICDRGRFSNHPVNAPDRPRTHLIDGVEATRLDALEKLAERLDASRKSNGGGSLAIVGSPRLSLEALALLPRLAKTLGARLALFATEAERKRTQAAASLLEPGQRASQEEVRQADLVVITGTDLLAEGAMMALAVRQAGRKGGKVYFVGEAPTEPAKLPFGWSAVSSFAEVPFAEALRPVTICGLSAGEAVLGEAARLPGKKVFLLPGPNSFAAAEIEEATSIEQALKEKAVRQAILFEVDIDVAAPGLEILAAADWLPTHGMQKAQITFPVTSYAEMDGTFVNYEGRAQRFRQAIKPGVPVLDTILSVERGEEPPFPAPPGEEMTTGRTVHDRLGGYRDSTLHPPRTFRTQAPGADLMPTWQIIARLIFRLTGEEPAEALAGRWEALRDLDAEGPGFFV